jgi:hypothetical protein
VASEAGLQILFLLDFRILCERVALIDSD